MKRSKKKQTMKRTNPTKKANVKRTKGTPDINGSFLLFPPTYCDRKVESSDEKLDSKAASLVLCKYYCRKKCDTYNRLNKKYGLNRKKRK